MEFHDVAAFGMVLGGRYEAHTAGTPVNDEQKFTKTSGLFAAALGFSVALGRRR